VNVASAESGTVDKVLVREGEEVRERQPLATLDVSVLHSQLAVAKAAKEAQGEVEVARAEKRLREERLAILSQLHRDRHASDEELNRARAELEIAQAQLHTAEEKRVLRALEYERLLAQIEARMIRAPQDGVITKVYKRRGEYVGPNDPAVFQLVQLHPLAVVFLVPRDQTGELEPGQTVSVTVGGSIRRLEGTVEVVSPMVEAGTQTVTVRVCIDNHDGALHPGEPCRLEGFTPPDAPGP
jgi:RND family efflux transporter MFP subunit